jgi:hypothetical protein
VLKKKSKEGDRWLGVQADDEGTAKANYGDRGRYSTQLARKSFTKNSILEVVST